MAMNLGCNIRQTARRFVAAAGTGGILRSPTGLAGASQQARSCHSLNNQSSNYGASVLRSVVPMADTTRAQQVDEELNLHHRAIEDLKLLADRNKDATDKRFDELMALMAGLAEEVRMLAAHMEGPLLSNPGNFTSPSSRNLENDAPETVFTRNEGNTRLPKLDLPTFDGNGEWTDEFTDLKSFSGKFYSISTIEEAEWPSLNDGVELMNKAEELFPSKTEAVEVAYQLFDEMLNPALTGLLTTEYSFSISLLGNEVISSPYEVGTRLADEPEQSHISKQGIVELRIGEVRSIMEVFLGKNVMVGDAHKVFDETLKLSSSLIDDDVMFSFDPGGSSLSLVLSPVDFCHIDDLLTIEKHPIIQKMRGRVEMDVPTYQDFKKIENFYVAANEIGLLTCEAYNIEIVGNELCKLSNDMEPLYGKTSVREIFNQSMHYMSLLSLVVKNGDGIATEMFMLDGVYGHLQTEQCGSAWHEAFSDKDGVELVFTTMKMSVVSPDFFSQVRKDNHLVVLILFGHVIKKQCCCIMKDLISTACEDHTWHHERDWITSDKTHFVVMTQLVSHKMEITDCLIIVNVKKIIMNSGPYVCYFLILEDKDVFERVGKDVVLMDTTLEINEMIMILGCLYGQSFWDPDWDTFYASRFISDGVGDTVGALDDIGLIPKTLIFSTAKLEHYIWDPGSFISVSQLSSEDFDGDFQFSTLRTRCSFRGGICHDMTFYYNFYMYFSYLCFGGL